MTTRKPPAPPPPQGKPEGDQPKKGKRVGKGGGKPPPDPKIAAEADIAKKLIASQIDSIAAGSFHLWKETTGALDEVIDFIVAGGHLNGFAEARGWDYTTIYRWINADPDRMSMYAGARVERSHALVDKGMDRLENCGRWVPMLHPVSGEPMLDKDGEPRMELIVTKEDIALAKAQNEAAQWYASRINRTYSEKHDVNATVDDKRALGDDALLKRLQGFGITGVALTPEKPAL